MAVERQRWFGYKTIKGADHGMEHVNMTSEWFSMDWLVGWLLSLFTQGKPLASGYYCMHPDTIQYYKETKIKI